MEEKTNGHWNFFHGNNTDKLNLKIDIHHLSRKEGSWPSSRWMCRTYYISHGSIKVGG